MSKEQEQPSNSLQRWSPERARKRHAERNETDVCNDGGIATPPESTAPPRAAAAEIRNMRDGGWEPAVVKEEVGGRLLALQEIYTNITFLMHLNKLEMKEISNLNVTILSTRK
jgi:hypothetical protein